MASDRLHEAYHQCFQQMMQRFVTPDVQLLYTPIHASRNQLNSQYQQLFENLKISMALRMKEEAKTLIHRLVSGIRQEPLLLQEYLPRVFLLIDQELENQLSICEFDPSFQQFYMLRFFDLEQIEQTMCRLVDTIPELREFVDIGDKVIDYIDKHYTQPLALRSLGELFHFNQIYLGQLIKRKTGILFNGYLNQLRIEKAKELIRTDPELLLKDLAYQLGYTDSHYFTKVFRQYVGVTPTEYKEKMGAS